MVSEQDLVALKGFIDETNDSLQDIENAFIELERDPANLDIITKIFRPVHSMKGNSGFFGLSHINRFAHRLEDLLDFIRRGEITVDKEIIDILLTGVEYLEGMINRVLDNLDDVSLRPEEEEFLQNKIETCKPQQVKGSLKSVLDLEKLLARGDELDFRTSDDSLVSATLEQIEKCNLYLEKMVDELEQLARISFYKPECSYSYKEKDCTPMVNCFHVVYESLVEGIPVKGELRHSLKEHIDEAQHLLKDEEQISEIFAELTSLLNFIDDDLMVASREFAASICTLLRQVVDHFVVQGGNLQDDEAAAESEKLGKILVDQGKISPEQLMEALSRQEKVGDILVKEGLISEDDLNRALVVQEKQLLNTHVKRGEGVPSGKSIRIDQSKLDSFAESVGDLFITLDSFNFLKRQLEQASVSMDIITRYTNTITTMDDMVAHLQEDIMSVRRLPVQILFQRFPKVIRKLSASLNKDIDFRLVGEETVIDKDLIEDIENPLVHILRNAVDHGIESPEARMNAGKQATGVLTLAASVDDEYVYLVIEDDGSGIDPVKMKEVAVKKGFMNERQVNELTDKDLVNLIFKAGFSSAQKISDVSGRGVGMDVVMSALQKNNGVIDVDSRVGKGTKVTITIPLTRTLVTREALIVKSAGQFFAIPSDKVTTTIYPEKKFVNILQDKNAFAYNGRILRVIDANDFFYGQPIGDTLTDEQVLVVCTDQNMALLVDQVFNHQQVVVKVFSHGYKQFRNIPGIYGYTVLGNEDIVLIVDVDKIAQEA
ncbi:MAG: chemotaxis protein CheA [Desulfobulbaceae bacterium]|nr:chemotaxis protein CheA [Desulfobulbaceae bacterium]